MKILFLSLAKIESLNDRGIYTDLLRSLIRQGCKVTAVTPVERRVNNAKTGIIYDKDFTSLKVKTLNIQKTNILEKTLGTLLIGKQYYSAINKYLEIQSFDLILYSTPPITLYSCISKIKNKFNIRTYLLLKDIFPQNAVDLRMMTEKGLAHKYFRNLEKKLYDISDKIGCMSPANVKYISSKNPQLELSKLHINPNSIEPVFQHLSRSEKLEIRIKYNLPIDKHIVVYGGNLGKPQGIEDMITHFSKITVKDVYFLVVGNGTERITLQKWFNDNSDFPGLLIDHLPKHRFDMMLAACDIGLIFLHKNFTIPNFPSRLLSYLESGMPVVSATDEVSDLGKIVESNNCGFDLRIGDYEGFNNAIFKLVNDKELYERYSNNARQLLIQKYDVIKSSEIILNSLR